MEVLFSIECEVWTGKCAVWSGEWRVSGGVEYGVELRILHVSGASCPVPSELSGAVDNLEIRQNSEFFTAQIGTGLIFGKIVNVVIHVIEKHKNIITDK